MEALGDWHCRSDNRHVGDDVDRQRHCGNSRHGNGRNDGNHRHHWHDGNHPGYSLGCWLREYKEQVFLFTRVFTVSWTNNCSEQAVKAAKRHQAVSGYWHTNRTLARWCRIRSYLDSAANHGLTVLDAITRALADDPWLPATAS